MKNKPLRHKKDNVFKFISFNERISNTKVSFLHKFKHKNELSLTEDAISLTHIQQAFEKWTFLCSSVSFLELKGEITSDIKSLPLLIQRKDELVEVIKKHLEAKNPLNLQPALEIVVALANDLREDFYPYFTSIYELLLKLLEIRNAEILEWVFECLAHLFKILWKYLISDMQKVFESVIPLLNKSKPIYIQNFAAHCFAFLARKIKDETKLIKLIVSSLKNKTESLEGCGRLLFEIVRIGSNWHSNGVKLFKSVLYTMRDDAYPHSILCQLLSSTLSHLICHLSLEDNQNLLDDILQNALSEFSNELEENNENNKRKLANVEQVICMMQLMVEHKRNHKIKVEDVIYQLLNVMKCKIPYHIQKRICDIISFVLLNARLTQALSSSTVFQVLDHLQGEMYLEFMLKIKSYTSFEGIVLPRLINYCQETIPPLESLPYLGRLILYKAPPATSIDQLLSHKPYKINFSNTRGGTPAHYISSYLSILKERKISEHLEKFDECIFILYLLPHLLPSEKECTITTVLSLMENFCTELKEHSENEEQCNKLISLICATLETIFYLKSNLCVTEIVRPEIVLSILLKYSTNENLFAIRALDFYVTLDKLKLILPFSDEIKTHLQPLLVSPYTKIRSHATHILMEQEKMIGSNKLMTSILETCWMAENISPNISMYRKRIKILEKLSCSSNDSIHDAVTKNTIDSTVPLMYLFGQLYVNFKLLWEPVRQIILSYSQIMDPRKFWQVYLAQINHVAAKIRSPKQEESREPLLVEKDFGEFFSNLSYLDDKPDYINYRVMIWEMLKELPERIYEKKSKDIICCFFSFMEEEYNKLYSETAKTWDIRLKSDSKPIDVSMLENNILIDTEEINLDIKSLQEPMEIEQNTLSIEENVKLDNGMEIDDIQESKNKSLLIEGDEKDLLKEELPESEWKNKWLTKILISHMAVFGKFKSPKSLYREKELNKIFLLFLSSKVKMVQQRALDFIMQYKDKHLTIYKEHLDGLMDDKTFKNELALFRIDTESDIKPEHRSSLIPVVLRLIYPKLFVRVISGKRNTREAIRGAIFRFLSGCKKEEIFNFFHITFFNLIDIIEDDALFMVDKIMDSFKLEQCTPPRSLMVSAHLLKIILIHCGGIFDQEQASFLLRLILIISSHIPSILTKKEEVHPGYIKMIKNVRTVCFQLISRFYHIYENYKWTENETDAVFKVIVWPSLQQLPSDSVNCPTTQFELFNTWSKSIKYFHLLDKKNADGRSVLSTVMELWYMPQLHGSVHNVLVDMICRILAEKDEEIDEEVGKKVLTEYIPQIMKVLDVKSKGKKSFSKKELQVLSIITTSPTDNIKNEDILSFILPSLLKSNKKDDNEILQLLTTSQNLISGVENPGNYLKMIIPLFSRFSQNQHRKLLTSLAISISEQSGSPLDKNLLQDLEAWDSKSIENPDFNRRLKAFSTIEEGADLNTTMASIVIHISFYNLSEEQLKESARHCLKTLCPRICLTHTSELGYLLDETIFPLIKRSMISNKQELRQESISILGYLVRECSSLHYVLSDLYPLGNKEDLEVDFFENLVHLQVHRRARAMDRFSEISMNPEHNWNCLTLMDFVYPLISHFLNSQIYWDKNNIIDSAIKAIGNICRLLPWKHYHTILLTFLNDLKFGQSLHKRNIRVVSEILDSFHFDLSAASKFKKPVNENSYFETEVTNGVKVDLKDEMDEVENVKESDNKEEKYVTSYKDIVLSKPAAERVVKELVKLIPNLENLIVRKNIADTCHKVNKNNMNFERNEEDILRAPLAIPIVKLLQNLPTTHLLNSHLPKVFNKLCSLLKSYGESVRRAARLTLETVMLSLGPKYLKALLSEMNSLLTRGFQVHVLAYTMHGVLQVLKCKYAAGDLDDCISLILPVCVKDLFGEASEEKEVNQITAKTFEARSSRSYDIFHILAAYISEKYLLDILIPMKQVLSETTSRQKIIKASDCLQQVVLGLTENKFLIPKDLLELAYGISTESIPLLLAEETPQVDVKTKEFESRRGPDIYIIPDEPKKIKSLTTVEYAKTNTHIFVEFGLKLIYFLLKREKIDKEDKSMLNPLVKLMEKCLSSQHVKVSTLAIQCLQWLVSFHLNGFQEHVKNITRTLFEILHRFASAGLSKGDNFDLVTAAFKTVATMIRVVTGWSISKKDMRILLLYCEQDLDEYDRQVSAFTLLKALIARRVEAKELYSIMKKVAEVSINSMTESVRLQARQVMLTYLMEFNLNKDQHEYLLYFFLEHLNNSRIEGRLSAVEMINMLVSAFPLEKLKEECSYILIQTATRFVTESEEKILMKIHNFMTRMIRKLDQNSRDMLFGCIKTWLTDPYECDAPLNDKLSTINTRSVGMCLIRIFAEGEDKFAERRLEELLLVVADYCRNENTPGKFVRMKTVEENDDGGKLLAKAKNLFTARMMTTVHKLLELNISSITDERYGDVMDAIKDKSHCLLRHSFALVRVTSLKILHMIFNITKKIPNKELVLDCIDQLGSTSYHTVDLLDETIMLLLLFADQVSLSGEEDTEGEFNLLWLIRKVKSATNREVVHTPKECKVRIQYCKWVAALAVKLDRSLLQKFAKELMIPIVKEHKSDIPELVSEAKRAAGHVKGKIGQVEYTEIVNQIMIFMEEKKSRRRVERSQLALTDPEKAAQIKIKKQEKKKVLKKRKMELIKENKFVKRKKRNDDDPFS